MFESSALQTRLFEFCFSRRLRGHVPLSAQTAVQVKANAVLLATTTKVPLWVFLWHSVGVSSLYIYFLFIYLLFVTTNMFCRINLYMSVLRFEFETCERGRPTATVKHAQNIVRVRLYETNREIG